MDDYERGLYDGVLWAMRIARRRADARNDQAIALDPFLLDCRVELLGEQIEPRREPECEAFR